MHSGTPKGKNLTVKVKERVEKLLYIATEEEQHKAIYTWIKRDIISFKEYFAILHELRKYQ
jgi:hypothetical protein